MLAAVYTRIPWSFCAATLLVNCTQLLPLLISSYGLCSAVFSPSTCAVPLLQLQQVLPHTVGVFIHELLEDMAMMGAHAACTYVQTPYTPLNLTPAINLL